MMYLMDGDGKNIRQICFEQDHDYTRASSTTAAFSICAGTTPTRRTFWNRVLMSMNPDGTGQMEYYGSNSYWPNSIFFARAIPNHPTKVAAIVTGHHEGRVAISSCSIPRKAVMKSKALCSAFRDTAGRSNR